MSTVIPAVSKKIGYQNSKLQLDNGLSRSFCECDRTLMKFLNDEQLTARATKHPAEKCVPGYANDIECCQYNKHFWAHFNPDRSCCGPDGVKEVGSC